MKSSLIFVIAIALAISLA